MRRNKCENLIDLLYEVMVSTAKALADLLKSRYILVLKLEERSHLIGNIATLLLAFRGEKYKECAKYFDMAAKAGQLNEEKKIREREDILLKNRIIVKFGKKVPFQNPFIPIKGNVRPVSIILSEFIGSISGDLVKQIDKILSERTNDISSIIHDKTSFKPLTSDTLDKIVYRQVKFEVHKDIDFKNRKILDMVEELRELMRLTLILVGMVTDECGVIRNSCSICDKPCSHCTTMCVTYEHEYLCASHIRPLKCSAVDYMLHTTTSVIALLQNKMLYAEPFEYNVSEGIEKSGKYVSLILKRCARSLMHICIHHVEIFEEAEQKTSLFERFIILIMEFMSTTSEESGMKDIGLVFGESLVLSGRSYVVFTKVVKKTKDKFKAKHQEKHSMYPSSSSDVEEVDRIEISSSSAGQSDEPFSAQFTPIFTDLTATMLRLVWHSNSSACTLLMSKLAALPHQFLINLEALSNSLAPNPSKTLRLEQDKLVHMKKPEMVIVHEKPTAEEMSKLHAEANMIFSGKNNGANIQSCVTLKSIHASSDIGSNDGERSTTTTAPTIDNELNKSEVV
ncbi:MAG: Mob1/phocein family protein [Puniceicoccales bacterium]|nr:Mob1/phocein family protein [Puniceicoccales bacterium]